MSGCARYRAPTVENHAAVVTRSLLRITRYAVTAAAIAAGTFAGVTALASNVAPPTEKTVGIDSVRTDGDSGANDDAGRNLIQNGGFGGKLGTTNWGWSNQAELVDSAHAGKHNARVADAAGHLNYVWTATSARVWSGVTYEASAYARHRGGGSEAEPQLFAVRYLDSSRKVLGWSSTVGTRSASWAKLTITFTPPANAYYAELFAGDFRGCGGNRGTYDWDDFALRELEAPPTRPSH